MLIPLGLGGCFLLLVASLVVARTETDRSAHGAQVPNLGGDA